MHTTTAQDDRFVAAFNGDGGKREALDYLLRDCQISHARDIASTLYTHHESLDKTRLGQCLGHHDEKWMRILGFYATLFSFEGVEFVAALRQFLWSFRLPGESMQIDRIMQAFAHSYMTQNNANMPFQHIMSSMKPSPSAVGWYITDVFSAENGETPCCIDCGITQHPDTSVAAEAGSILYKCRGCDCVTFCRKCAKYASRCGHAVCGRVGYGRACMAALKKKGALNLDDDIQYSFDGKSGMMTEAVDDNKFGMALSWEQQCCPFVDEDSAYVFAFSVIMLTTNLHNPNVKNKMTKQQFLATNKGTNCGKNLPGDFVACVFDDIKSNEIKFQGQA